MSHSIKKQLFILFSFCFILLALVLRSDLNDFSSQSDKYLQHNSTHSLSVPVHYKPGTSFLIDISGDINDENKTIILTGFIKLLKNKTHLHLKWSLPEGVTLISGDMTSTLKNKKKWDEKFTSIEVAYSYPPQKPILLTAYEINRSNKKIGNGALWHFPHRAPTESSLKTHVLEKAHVKGKRFIQ